MNSTPDLLKRHWVVLIAISLTPCAAMAQSSSDICGLLAANKYPVNNNNCVLYPFNVSNGFVANMNPNSCSSGNNVDAWGWFTATDSFTVVKYDPETSHRPILHVFTGNCSNLSLVACHNAGSAGLNAQVVIATIPGQDYFIRVQRHNSNSAMPGSLCVYVPPANDSCPISIELDVQENACDMQTFTTQGATHSTDTPLPVCGGTINSSTVLDIWFNFYAPSSGIVQIETQAGTLTDAVMQLYRNSCGNLVLQECDDNDGPGNMPRIDTKCSPLTPYQLYTLRIFGRNGAMGTFGICINSQPSFSNPHQDCAGAVTICNSQSISSNATDFGCSQDLNSTNRGCLASNERQGTWYFFSPSATGTLELTITPVNALGDPVAVDYDFAIWGPYDVLGCAPGVAPMRCSYASPTNSGMNVGAGTYLTGLKIGEADNSEPAYNGVNGFVAPIVVPIEHVGKRYILFVDNFSQTGQSFNLDWTLTNGASLDCMVLPVELVGFQAIAQSDLVLLAWTTMSENNSDHFVIERSADGIDFTPIGTAGAAGYSYQRIDYKWADEDPLTGLSYYRLKQMDVDGSWQMSDVVAVNYTALTEVVVYPNPADGLITLELLDAHEGVQEVRIFHMSGSLVNSMKFLPDGSLTRSIPIHDLRAGTYFVEVIDGSGGSRMGRFLKE